MGDGVGDWNPVGFPASRLQHTFMTQNRKFLYAFTDPKSSSHVHRTLWPLKWTATEAEFADRDFDLSVSDPVGDYRYFLVHGSFSANNVEHFARWRRRNAGKFILSLDDDYFTVPSTSPARMSEEFLDVHQMLIDHADWLLSSTPHLTKVLGHPQKTLTAPNLMQVNDYNIQTPAPVNPSEPLRILWAGSKTHNRDWESVGDACHRILQKWKWPSVEFIFVGFCPGNLLRDYLHCGVHFESWVHSKLYPKTIAVVRPHLVLAPLEDHVFNYSKSAIRTHEAGCVAAPVVASNVGPYSCVRHGVDGFHANSPDEWFHYIDKLLSDRELRESMGAAARQRVWQEAAWENPPCREEWRQVIRRLSAAVN